MKTIILFLFLFSISFVSAQSRFDQFIAEGKEELKAQNFEKAINKFKAAKITPDISANQIRQADQQIESARDGFIAAIQKANGETQVALEKAQKEARVSEANRLAFLANQYVERGNSEEGFQVAAIAMNMVKGDAPNLVEKAFGDAGYHHFSKTLENENAPVLEIYPTINGKQFIVRSRSHSLLLFENSGSLIQRMAGHKSRVLDLAVSKNNMGFASCSEDGAVIFWNKKGDLENTYYPESQLFAKKVVSVFNNEYVALFNDKTIKVFSSEGSLIHSLQEESRITNLLASPNGKYFLSCTAKGKVKLWGSTDKSLIKELDSSGKYIYQAVFSTDGSRIFLISQGSPVLVFDLSGQLIASFKSKSFSESAYELCLSPDGKHLAIASEKGLVEVWTTEGDFVTSFQRKKDKPGLITFSPDNKSLASIYDDQSFVLWDVKNKDAIFFDQHKAEIIALSFAPEGQYLLSASKDQTAKIWSFNGSLLTNLDLHTAPLTFAQFTKDSNSIITGGMDYQVFIAPTFKSILKYGKEVSVKGLTKNQKEKWGLE